MIYYSSTHFVLSGYHYHYSSTHLVLFDFNYLLLINSFCIIWSSLLFNTHRLSLFLFCSHLFSSHISFLMADANAKYLSPKPYYLLLINTLHIILSSLLFTTHYHSLFLFYFLFFFFSHILHFWWLMLMPCIIQVLLFITHLLIIYSLIIFSSTHFFPPWMVDANFIFILVFTSSYFCFILRMRHGLFILSHFIYNVLPLLYTFSSFMFIPHCKYFLSCFFF